jgi:DNA-binding transcriptional regulator YiaG
MHIMVDMAKSTPLAQWIYDFRLHLDLTQADFARELKVSVGTVQQWEYAARTSGGPTLLLLERMAREQGFAAPPEVDSGRGPRRP